MLTQIGDILRDKTSPQEKIGSLLKFQDVLEENFSGYQRYNITMVAASVGLLAVAQFAPPAAPWLAPVALTAIGALGLLATTVSLVGGTNTGAALDSLLGEQMAQLAEKAPPESTVSPALLRSVKQPFNAGAARKYDEYTALLQEYIAARPAPAQPRRA